MLNHPADARSYEIACLILQDLGIDSVRLLTNNPEKMSALDAGGIRVVERIAMAPRHWKQIGVEPTQDDERNEELDVYMRAKIDKMGHVL